MLRHFRCHRRLVIATLLVAALGFVDIASWAIAPHEYGGRYDHGTYQCPYRGGAVISGVVFALQFIGGLTPEAWTAIGTIAVAGFTYTLWLTSRELGRLTQASIDATEKIGNAAIAAELPILLVQEIELSEWVGHGKVSSVVGSGAPPKRGKVKFIFHNYGRSVARLTSFCLQHYVAWELPPTPTYDDPIPLPNYLTIERDKALPLVPPDSQNIHISDGDMDRITEKSPDLARLWVYGYLGFRDFRGKLHRTGFCYRWHTSQIGLEIGERMGFHEEGPPEYIYNKSED